MKRLLFFLGLLGFTFSNAQPTADTLHVYEPAQLQSDWDTLYAQLRNNHPALYAQWPKKQADAAFEKLKKQLNRPLTHNEFELMARQFIAGFQDGHTFVDTDFNSKQLTDYGKRGGKLFPLGVSIIEGKIYCSNNSLTNANIPLGAEIVTINNRSAKEVLQTLISLQSADDKRSGYVTTQRLFGLSIWRTYGWGQQTKVSFLHNGKKQSALIEGIAPTTYRELAFGKGPIRQLHLYPEYQLAVLQINSYANATTSRAFIDSSFQVIKEKGIRHIALDLRQNGGGNSAIGEMVLNYITRKPYADVNGKTWLDGPLMQSVTPDNWRYKTMEQVRKSWSQVSPNLYHKTFNPIQPDTLKRPELFSDATFYLLTSGITYSSAHMTALSVKCSQLGTIIGQPTGERLDLTGEIIGFILPHTKLSVWVPTALFTSACGNGKQVGVQPDYYVPIRARDIKEGRDAELSFLKELIRKENKSLVKK
jgi:hypothetical protein